MTARLVAAFIGAYLLGAIPTSYLVVRFVRGDDLRTMGSGNLGATNLYRVLGWKFALPVAVFDAGKGALPVAVFAHWAGTGLTGALLLGITAVIGHMFSVFVGFRGGKGVATSAGVVLAFAPAAFGVALALWGIVLTLSGYVSLASIVAALTLPAAVWLFHPSHRSMVVWFGGLAALVVWMHRTNIRRLLTGTEDRVVRNPAAAAAPPT